MLFVLSRNCFRMMMCHFHHTIVMVRVVQVLVLALVPVLVPVMALFLLLVRGFALLVLVLVVVVRVRLQELAQIFHPPLVFAFSVNRDWLRLRAVSRREEASRVAPVLVLVRVFALVLALVLVLVLVTSPPHANPEFPTGAANLAIVSGSSISARGAC